jgi:RNA polymerase sigma-70 factor (ECF subfamily)
MTAPEFQAAYHGHKDVIFRFAFRMTASAAAAEDITQDSFMALWRNPGSFDPGRGTLRAFLLGVARNLALRKWRAERPHETLDDELSICEPLDMVGKERAAAVARAVAMLPPLQREAVILAEYEEMPLEQIARVTGSELAAVKSRLHRGRQNLRALLAPLLEARDSVNGTR